MEQQDKSIDKMWQDYLMSLGTVNSTNKKYSAWHFCDNEEDANHLAELVKQGVKRATAGLQVSYEAEGEDLPEPGDLIVILDWQGKAQCVIEIKKVTLTPFKEVSAEFARTEGEGDKSLKYWREVHRAAFSRELKEAHLEFQEELVVVLEEFEVVYK